MNWLFFVFVFFKFDTTPKAYVIAMCNPFKIIFQTTKVHRGGGGSVCHHDIAAQEWQGQGSNGGGQTKRR